MACRSISFSTWSMRVQATIPTAAILTNASEKVELTLTLTLTLTVTLTLALALTPILTLTHCITLLEMSE